MSFLSRVTSAVFNRASSDLRSEVSNAFSVASSARAELTRDDPRRYMQVIPYQMPAGVVVTMDNALQLSIVWGCVMAITNALAPCRWNVITRTGGQRQVLDDDSLSYLLSVRPNPEMTGIAFREAMFINVLTWGNSYAEIVRSPSGKVTALWPLMPDRTYPIRDPETKELVFAYQQQDGGFVFLPAEKVFHLRGPGITGLMGDNLVARAAKAISLNAAQERFSSTYYGNNTVVSGVIEYPKTMSDTAFKRLRDEFEDRHKGPDKSNRPMLLEGGATWKPISASSAEAQVLEARRFSVEDICRWYGVPPHKVQHLDRATFNNIEHLSIDFFRSALLPWTARLEQEANYKLVGTRAPARETALDTAWLTQGDFKSRAEGYEIMRRIGVLSANDIRQMEGMNGIGPEGDIRIVEMNMQTMDQLGHQKLPEIYQYHIQAGIPTLNEVRARLGLPPVPDGDRPANALSAGVAPAPGEEKPEETKDGETEKDPKKAGKEDAKEEPKTAGKPPPPKKTEDVLRGTVTLMFSSVFDRYARRLANRAADLRRGGKSEADVQALLAEERERCRPAFLAECDGVLRIVDGALSNEVVVHALDAVDSGASAESAAACLAEVLLPRGSR